LLEEPKTVCVTSLGLRNFRLGKFPTTRSLLVRKLFSQWKILSGNFNPLFVLCYINMTASSRPFFTLTTCAKRFFAPDSEFIPSVFRQCNTSVHLQQYLDDTVQLRQLLSPGATEKVFKLGIIPSLCSLAPFQ